MRLNDVPMVTPLSEQETLKSRSIDLRLNDVLMATPLSEQETLKSRSIDMSRLQQENVKRKIVEKPQEQETVKTELSPVDLIFTQCSWAILPLTHLLL